MAKRRRYSIETNGYVVHNNNKKKIGFFSNGHYHFFIIGRKNRAVLRQQCKFYLYCVSEYSRGARINRDPATIVVWKNCLKYTSDYKMDSFLSFY